MRMRIVGHALLMIVLADAAARVGAGTLYVSPQGSDANSGRGVGPRQALQTIQAAVDRLQPGDTCMVLGGTYRETVVFPRSGESGRPITLRPCKGQKVTVTGCEPVGGWTRHKGNIWRAPMNWTLGLGRNEIFDDSGVMIEARYPKTPSPGLGMYVSDLSPLWPTFGAFSMPEPKKDPGRLVSHLLDGQPEDYWKGAIYYGVHFHGWAAQTGVIESSKPGEICVGDRTETWWFPAHYDIYSAEEGRGMIVGHMNALSQPGEWVWQDNTLYLIPRGDGPPTGIEARKRQLAFDLSGREYIHIQGLGIRACSMRLADSAHCLVDGCDLSYISHFTRLYDIGQVEHGRDTLKSGETGIFISGHDNSFLNCTVRFSAGAGFYLRGYHHTIHNCLIDEVDYTSHYLNAITDAVSDYPDYENLLVGGHVITHNTMRNAGRHFFNFYGNGTSTASRNRGPMDYMATLFAHNHLYNGMLGTRDAGFLTGYFSSGGTLDWLNSQVIYNVMHDSYDIAAMKWNKLGIVYLDSGTCNVDLRNNLLWAAPGSLQHGLWYNTACVDLHDEKNVFYTNFTRTCAELTPEDFPLGQPFRFGHDFQHPPPVPHWPPLASRQIEPTNAPSPISLKDGACLGFGRVDFNEGWQSAILRFAGGAKEMNTDKAARARPRHHFATDPLVLEAICNDGAQNSIRKQWTFIYQVKSNSWLLFKQVPLGAGYRRFRAVYGSDCAAPRHLEVHLDDPAGPLVGRIELRKTDEPRREHIQIYGEALGEVSAQATGTHDVALVFCSDDDKPVGEFEYFRFEQYRGQIPLQSNEVKFELRLGSPDGGKIGEFYPRFTDGAFREFVATLEPVRGRQALFLVARSALAAPLGNMQWLTLQRSVPGAKLAGIGPTALSDWSSKLLPQPTHRPCARPADDYTK
ncbi:MAG TPA: carbohydrate-binding protein [Candidatus Acidoferrum sp.]|nr:carbohydrate-binding protein [Candidatus Acidoferrum sp.]